MATMNPLERKARNSFIKGLAIAGVIGILIIAFLIVQLITIKGEEKQRIDTQKTAKVLKQEVKSGESITASMLQDVKIDATVAPSNLLTMLDEDTVAKIDIAPRTVLTENMVSVKDELVTSDVRKQEYNMIALPADLETGETIDIRLRMTDGTDYIVVSKKRVTVIDEGGIPSLNTISVELSEGETLLMSNAIVESYQVKGSRLYISKYVEPGLQNQAIITYVPNTNIQNLIASNPNIVNQAKQELLNRIQEQGNLNRGNINNVLSTIDQDDRKSGVETGTQTELTTSQDERQKYLDGLGG